MLSKSILLIALLFSFSEHIHTRATFFLLFAAYVGTVLARDRDADLNAFVRYEIDTTATSATGRENYFTIDGTSGRLTTDVTKDLLDFESFASVEVVVKAYDNGNPQQSSFQTITISLEDVNDQKPYFERDKNT